VETAEHDQDREVPVSISPASDIVLDVARAADPARSELATARLVRLARGDAASTTDFAGLVEAQRREPVDTHVGAAWGLGEGPRMLQRPDSRTKAIDGLEQMILQKLVEAMLPKETGTLFGRGTGGEVWRSMLAEQLAAQIGSVMDLGVGRAVPWPTRSELSTPGAGGMTMGSEALVVDQVASRKRDE
jgi:hypothetical protein